MAFNISIQHDLKKLKRGLTSLEVQVLPQTTIRTLNRVAESANPCTYGGYTRRICQEYIALV